MIGGRSYFNRNEPGFSDIFADVAKRQRERKDKALGEIQGILDTKLIYGPYAQEAQGLLTAEVDKIAESLDVNQADVTKAAADYTKFWNYSNQFQKFIEESAAAYKADNEVNMPTALAAIKQNYVKTGKLDELEQNILQGMDAEEVLIKTPGALKEDQVIRNRLDQLGKMIQDITTPGNLTPAQGAAKRYYFGMDEEQLKMEFNKSMVYDAATGQVRIKNAREFLNSGLADALLQDSRMKALVDRRITQRGDAPTDEARVAELPRMLEPFSDSKMVRSVKREYVRNPAWEEEVQRARIAMERSRAAGDAPDSQALILAQNVAATTGLIMQSKPKEAVNRVFQTTEYVRNSNGEIINKATGRPLAPNEKPEQHAERAKSPAGIGFYGSSDAFLGYESPKYKFGRLMVDKNGNAFVEAFPKEYSTTSSTVGETGEVQTTVKVSDRPSYIQFSPSLFDETLRDAKARSSYNQLISGVGISTFSQPLKMYNPKGSGLLGAVKPVGLESQTGQPEQKKVDKFGKE